MYKFRKANQTDREILLEWANDSLSRKMSLNSDLISIEEHNKWFSKSLKNSQIDLFIFEELFPEGKSTPIANLRVNNKNSRQYLSWNVSPKMRGKGIGGTMLHSFVNQFKGHYHAIIKTNNLASMAICSNSGFKKYYSKNNLTYWKNF